MGVNLLVSEIKFFNEFYNDIGFAGSPSSTSQFFLGSVMENQKTTRFVDISWNLKSITSASTWSVSATNLTISSTGGSFLDAGFVAGDTFNFEDLTNPGVIIFTATIDSINNTFISFTTLTGAPATSAYTDAIIRGTTPLEASVYGFGLLGANESYNVVSKVSGNDQGYYSATVGLGSPARDTSFQTMIKSGIYEDWRTGSMRIRFVTDTPNGAAATDGIQRFEIEHEFMVVPFYVDGELGNLQDLIQPALFAGINTIKYSFSPGFRNSLTDVDSEKSVVSNNNRGGIAWFNENLNGFQNKYAVKSVTYEEVATSDAADSLFLDVSMRTIITVENTTTPYVGGERYGVYVSYLPTQSEYTDKTLTDLKTNFIYDRAINNEGAGPVAGSDFITSIDAAVVSGDLVITMESEYSTTQKAFLSGKVNSVSTNYLIAVQLGDVANLAVRSDRVMLIADVNQYIEKPKLTGPMNVTQMDIYAPNKIIGADTPSTDYTGWNEDGITFVFNFNLDLNKSAVIEELSFKLAAYNTLTDQILELDNYNYNVASAVVSGGVQQLIEDTTRGYILESGNQFNKITLEVGTNVGGVQNYNGIFAQKLSWQSWLENLNIDTIFFDPAEPNNNRNFKSSNYSLTNDYEIRMIISGRVTAENDFGVVQTEENIFVTPTITVYDYGDDGNVTPIWSHTTELLDSNNASNIGTVLSGTDTVFRVTWTNVNGPVLSLTDLWAFHRIEFFEQPGYDNEEINTDTDSPNNQFLIPSSGTRLSMTLDSGNVVTECLVDGSNIDEDTCYSLSMRLGDDTVVVFGKAKSPSGTTKFKGGTTTNKLKSP